MSIVARLLLLFTLMPIIEISLLIPLHSGIGGWATFALVCVTATLGTIMVKWQGGLALQRIKEAISRGALPGEEIIDGVLVLVAGVTLITPGIVTDTTGLLLLVPFIRKPVRGYAKKKLLSWMELKTESYAFGGVGGGPSADSFYDGGHGPDPARSYGDDGYLGEPDGIFGTASEAPFTHTPEADVIDITPEPQAAGAPKS